MSVDPGILLTRGFGFAVGAAALAGLYWYARAGHFTEDPKFAMLDGEDAGSARLAGGRPDEGGDPDGPAGDPRG